MIKDFAMLELLTHLSTFGMETLAKWPRDSMRRVSSDPSTGLPESFMLEAEMEVSASLIQPL